MKRIGLFLRIIFIIGITGFVLYWSKSYFAYNIASMALLLYMLILTAISHVTNKEKVIHVTIYTIIMIFQMSLNFLLIKLYEHNDNVFLLCKLISILMILLPFFIKKILYHLSLDYKVYSFFDKCYGTIYSQLIYDRETIVDKIERVKNASQKITREQVNEIIKDAPRHSAFSYINNGSLSEKYFEKAYSTIENGYIYLVISKSKSAASEVIGAFTNKKYNHISLSFDRELHTTISYNGGANIFSPGLNPEIVMDLVSREGASSVVYRLEANANQKLEIINKVKEINEVGSAYNVTGLLFGYSHRDNIMFCSQFVYMMLEIVKLNYFEKDVMRVKPTDFIELDYYRRLEFVFEITGKDTENILEETDDKIKIVGK